MRAIKISFVFYLPALLSTILCLRSFAEVNLSSLFTDNMILQQQSEVPIWGWAKAGSNISLTSGWDNKKYRTQADASGKWKVKVLTPTAGGPYEIFISDGTPVKLKNILIGEVWLCSGQSNMEMPLRGFKGQPVTGSNEVILKSKNKNIRLYTVPRSSQTTPQENSKPSEWKEANPESVSNFSATAYFFGKLLNEILNVPIGLINASYGGSPVEAWMSAHSLQSFSEIKIPARSDSIQAPNRTPTGLYNGMLHPVIGYGIKGVIW